MMAATPLRQLFASAAIAASRTRFVSIRRAAEVAVMAARPQPKGDCGAPGEKKMRPTDAVLQYVVVIVAPLAGWPRNSRLSVSGA
jgi:hypothetical protein